MAGYCGKKMSNNAVAAYAAGEKPLSRWTKAEMLEEIRAYSDCDFSKLTKAEILNNFFARSSWHHTGMYYNCTDFYSLDYNAIRAADQVQINAILADRSPRRARRDADIIAAEKAAKEARKEAQIKEERIKLLFNKQSKYKTLNGFKKNPAYIAACDAALEAATDAEIEHLKKCWARLSEEKQAQLLPRLENREYVQAHYVSKI